MASSSELRYRVAQRMNVFAYGTLQIPDVMYAVTGRRFASDPGTLDGYERLRVRARTYPGIIVAPGCSTAGRLYRDVDARALELLDRFEGRLYERRLAMVTTEPDGAVRAQVYIVPVERRRLLSDEPWDLERFVAEDLRRFISSARAFYRREGGR